MPYEIPAICPICGEGLRVTRLKCIKCNSAIKGEFELDKISRLTPAMRNFILDFFKCRGNIREIERLYGISYPTVRARIDEIVAMLDGPPPQDEPAHAGAAAYGDDAKDDDAKDDDAKGDDVKGDDTKSADAKGECAMDGVNVSGDNVNGDSLNNIGVIVDGVNSDVSIIVDGVNSVDTMSVDGVSSDVAAIVDGANSDVVNVDEVNVATAKSDPADIDGAKGLSCREILEKLALGEMKLEEAHEILKDM